MVYGPQILNPAYFYVSAVAIAPKNRLANWMPLVAVTSVPNCIRASLCCIAVGPLTPLECGSSGGTQNTASEPSTPPLRN